MTVELNPPEEFPTDGDSAQAWGKWILYAGFVVVAGLIAWMGATGALERLRALASQTGGSLNLKNGIPGVGS
jgi:hypothetical protein